jgi:hypothetical protein
VRSEFTVYQVTTQISLEAAMALLDMAHRIAHKSGGCDTRPLLFGALALRELSALYQRIPAAAFQEALLTMTQQISFAASVCAEQLYDKYHDQLPEEVQKVLDEERANTPVC